MNVVCRLMCREELDTFIRGEEIVKGNKGDKRYEEVVGDKLAFTPVKFYDLISMGDITVIFHRTHGFYQIFTILGGKVQCQFYILISINLIS